MRPSKFLIAAAAAATLSALVACGGGDTTGPNAKPTQRLDIIPANGALPGLSGKSLAIAPGDSARLSAIVNMSNGSTALPSGLTWSIGDEAVATIDASGVLRAKAIGTTTMIARAAALADTVTVTVSTCGSAQSVTLAVGQVQDYAAGLGTLLCINGSSTSEEYAIVAYNADADTGRATANVRNDVRVTATGVAAPAAGVQELAAAAPSLSRAALSADESHPRAESFDLALRRTAERTLRPMMAAARQQMRASRPAGLRLSVAQGPSVIGEIVTLNTGLEPCDTNRVGGLNRRKGRVVAITNRAIVVADTANPTGGFTDAEYQAFGVAFDTLAYPVNIANFGAETDVDKNGKSIIFFTSAVNAMTPARADYYVGGFFYERDLYPNNVPEKQGGCGASNAAEMFYMLVPDPNGRVNGNRFTKAFVQGVTVGTLAHEFQHLINAGRRLHVNDAQDWETTWLNEGLSHIAEELVFYRAAGLTPRTPRLDGSAITATTTVRSAFNAYNGTQGNIGRLVSYLEGTEGSSPYADNDDLETRGATWLFLRYAADRINGNDATLWQKLVSTTKLAGMANLQAAFGVNGATLADWFRDWSVANYVDGLTAGTLDPRFTYRSYNLRSVIASLRNSNGSASYPTYPLFTHTLAEAAPAGASVRPGTAAYYRFGVAAGKQARLETTGANGAPMPTTFRISVARIK